MSADEIERLVSSVDWQDSMQDRPPRAELGFRRKQDDRNFLVRYALGVNSDGFLLSKGLIQGQKLAQILRNATVPVADIKDFDQLPVPFRALATDLESGSRVILKSGDLVTAMRASMSAPGVFTPTQLDGRLLVDGGLMDNLPVDVAREMNVDLLIVVDVSFSLYARDELQTPLDVTNQAFAIMIRSRTAEQIAKLGPQDVFINPDLGRIKSTEFTRVPQALRAGYEAADAARNRLAALALDDIDYTIYLASRNPRKIEPPRLAFVRVDQASHRYARMVDETMEDIRGGPLDRDLVAKRMSSLYALDLFESIDYSVVTEGAETGLEFHLRRKSWGPNYVRFGINIEDDFEGNSRYNAAARFIMTELNELGAEWVTDLQIGDNPRFATEFYQPLAWRNRYFVAPRFAFEVRNLQIRDPNGAIAELRTRTYQGAVDVGREFSNWGELRTGLQFGGGSSKVRIGDPNLERNRFNSSGFFVRFSYDKLDSVYFPRKGQQFTLEWNAERSGLGADQSTDRIDVNWLIARSLDRNTLIFSTDFGSTLNDRSPAHDYFQLGGFLSLSGLTQGSLSGPHYAIGRLIYYRKIGKGGTGVFDFPTYVGLSFEAGNTWLTRSDASFSGLHKDASVFLGVDTFLGPLYLATGHDSTNQTAFYLFLGRTF
jgi:NTE family protein